MLYALCKNCMTDVMVVKLHALSLIVFLPARMNMCMESLDCCFELLLVASSSSFFLSRVLFVYVPKFTE